MGRPKGIVQWKEEQKCIKREEKSPCDHSRSERTTMGVFSPKPHLLIAPSYAYRSEDEHRLLLSGRTSAPAAVWPDAWAELCAAAAERVALDRGCNIRARRRKVGAVAEKIDYADASGPRQSGNDEPLEPADLAVACSGSKFEVSGPGDTYDELVRDCRIGDSS